MGMLFIYADYFYSKISMTSTKEKCCYKCEGYPDEVAKGGSGECIHPRCECHSSQALSTEEKLYICPNGIHKNSTEPCTCDTKVPTESWNEQLVRIAAHRGNCVNAIGDECNCDMFGVPGFISSLLESEKKHAVAAYKEELAGKIEQRKKTLPKEFTPERLRELTYIPGPVMAAVELNEGLQIAIDLIRNSDTRI